MSTTVRVGIIGAGPWVPMFYVPVLRSGPETEIAGIWARRPEATAELAAAQNIPAFDDLDGMFESCDAVVISVAPAAQPGFAIRAAAAGKALVLEKPLAESLTAAEDLVAALAGLNAPAMLMLTNRYNTVLRDRLAEARAFEAFAARGLYVSGGFLPGSQFAYGWRLERGPLLDIGPHIIDLAWESLGPVVGVRASGDLQSAVHLELEQQSGVRTQILVSTGAAVGPQIMGLELFGPEGRFEVDPLPGRETTADTIRKELAAMVATREPHTVGVERGLALQRIIEEAERQLGS